MKTFKFTRKTLKMLKDTEMISLEDKPISFNKEIKVDGCEPGEESIVISIFSKTLENKKYFKEIK